MSHYLLTGAAGFIGARTAELLLEQGHRVVGLDSMNDYYPVRLKEHRLERLRAHEGFSFYPLDIEDMPSMSQVFSGARFDAVINLAARAGVRYSMENPHVYLTTNAGGTLNLLELMREHGIGKLVQASTSSLYAGQPMPFCEDLSVNQPISPYAASKKAAEVMAYTYHHLYGIDVSVVRYFTVYGPAGRPDMAPLRFVRWIDEGAPIRLFGDGGQARDFTYVDDCACGTIAALKPLGYEVLNIGGGSEPVTINTMIACFARRLGKEPVIDYQPAHQADMRETSADITRARELLGWEPKVGWQEGFDRTVDWYCENRGWLAELEF